MDKQRKLFDEIHIRMMAPKLPYTKGVHYVVMIDDKWEDTDIQGAMLALVDEGGRVAGQALVTSIQVCKARDIPKEVFTRYMLSECKNPIVFMDHLRSRYGMCDVTGDTRVVCIGFEAFGNL